MMTRLTPKSARLLAGIGGIGLSASLAMAQLPATGTSPAPGEPARMVIPDNLPAGVGLVRIQSAAPAAPAKLPEVATPPTAMPSTPATPPSTPPAATPPASTPPAANTAAGPGCPNGNCEPGVMGRIGKTQPTDPCGPGSSWGPEMPTMPVGRNTGTGPDGLGFGPCRLPRVPGAGTGVTFRQCWNNTINMSRTPAIMANPNGTFTRMAFERQRINALAEYFVVYKEEFAEDGKTMTASGIRHVCGIAKRFESCRPLPIQVEVADTTKEIGEARKLAVVDVLVKLGIDPKLAIMRVEAINYCGPRAEPLRYEMIEQVGNGAMQSFQGQGGNFGGGNLGTPLGGFVR